MVKKTDENRIIDSSLQNGDQILDLTLRPQLLDEFIGQEKIKKSLQIFMQAAKQRQEPIEHVLLYGPPGLGKTTLAHIIAKEMNVNIKVTSGPALEKAGDLAAILTNLSEGDILFIDEIHRLNKLIEEVLYPAMEDYALDIVIGKGPSARTLRIDLPRFTILGATTRYNLLSSPLRDRFGATYHLNYYEVQDIKKIIHRSAKILKVAIDEAAIDLIAVRSRLTPRTANRLVKRVRDYVQVKSDGSINGALAQEALEMMEIDTLGLDAIDRKIIEIIIEKFKGGPVGLNSIAAATGEESGTVEEIYEPYLMQLGLIMRTSRGRVVTEAAYEHLGLLAPDNWQDKLV
ncbi:MAG: Holliday junction branch migration DNA helicase RuvB [Candidatus Komeilibacteria bacterium CG_4_10_14_0_2_um_filter_37_10]|uniref:Holliday junction branch migration complex subunit RuvB n=1 Tax=Candidatus Komeilibacteria bacterium CG_4_10_14_0_2_um_filter_37_10 TaxID=1974470 RepID=A0A2M7VEZ7_9BACT|nr:MAG: Holliday junction branch migration DNA helicase RuvB [Candidatus Komeilibacteria bacterium CG_4_10_14_0_2_um_filter_37_10]